MNDMSLHGAAIPNGPQNETAESLTRAAMDAANANNPRLARELTDRAVALRQSGAGQGPETGRLRSEARSEADGSGQDVPPDAAEARSLADNLTRKAASATNRAEAQRLTDQALALRAYARGEDNGQPSQAAQDAAQDAAQAAQDAADAAPDVLPAVADSMGGVDLDASLAHHFGPGSAINTASLGRLQNVTEAVAQRFSEAKAAGGLDDALAQGEADVVRAVYEGNREAYERGLGAMRDGLKSAVGPKIANRLMREIDDSGVLCDPSAHLQIRQMIRSAADARRRGR